MGSHANEDHSTNRALDSAMEALLGKTQDLENATLKERLASLKDRAGEMEASGESSITVGDEPIYIADVALGGGRAIHIERRPADKDGVLRISVGSMPGLPDSDYCHFRGDPAEVRDLLSRALRVIANKVPEIDAALETNDGKTE